ncbi:MAG: hypothetical protein R6V55_13485, partial [Desulfovermiculus sp.]
PIELRDLDKISRVALSSRKDLVVATVDRMSKAIYYSVKNEFRRESKSKVNKRQFHLSFDQETLPASTSCPFH